MANAEKLLKLVGVLADAKERGEWDQGSWGQKTSCGTTLCAAGWQCVIEGKKLEYNARGEAYNTTDGDEIPSFAQKSLGLTSAEADLLFWNTGTNLDEVEENVEAIIAGEIDTDYYG